MDTYVLIALSREESDADYLPVLRDLDTEVKAGYKF